MSDTDTALAEQERIALASELLEASVARLGGWGTK